MSSPDREVRRWTLYALGGGMGHLTRAVALARAARRKLDLGHGPPTQIRLLTNSPFADDLPIAAELGDEDRVETLSPSLSAELTSERVAETLKRNSPDLLVVDTFPRGLAGELLEILPALNCRKVLVHRDLNPRYVAKYDLSRFVQNYDRILLPGESAPFGSLPGAMRTSPWLIRDDHELLEPIESRRNLGIDSDALPIVAVLGCGKAGEVEQMRSFATRLTARLEQTAIVRFVVPDSSATVEPPQPGLTEVNVWPFFESVAGVSLVIGGGGYNTVHEARASGKHLIAMSWPRLYDRQSVRLRDCERVDSLEQAERRVIETVASGALQSTPKPRFRNGVHEALEAIEQIL